MFAVTELEQPLWRLARHTSLYPAGKRLAADVAIASQEFKDMASVLEQHMHGREFVVGEAVSVGDFVLAYTLDCGNAVDLLGYCPRLKAYMEKMYSRPRAAPHIRQALASIGS